MVDGITIQKKKSAVICIVNHFSDELKELIRARLSEICHGPDAVVAGAVYSSYSQTLTEFIKRYDKKHENTKKGMIAELLAHILLFKAYPSFEPVSPYFNIEERAIKKGFDVVVFEKENNRMWITEVKSGNAKEKKADSFNKKLINIAKNDLKERLSENETNLWLNAINGAKIALSSGDFKTQINELLQMCYSEAANETQTGLSKNVILVSVIYRGLDDLITLNEVKGKRKKINDNKIFSKVIVFSIQKETFQKVASFLKSEASI